MLLFFAITVVVMVPVAAYWANWLSETKARNARLNAIQKRLDEISREKSKAGH